MATIVISTAGSAFSQEVVLPEGEAKEIVEAAYSSCHALSEVTKNRLSREDWQEMVSIMIEFGAELEESQIPRAGRLPDPALRSGDRNRRRGGRDATTLTSSLGFRITVLKLRTPPSNLLPFPRGLSG